MYYCEKCHSVYDENSCLSCGIEQLRKVRDDDFCFLTTVSENFGKMIIECFKNEGINYAIIPVGDGVRSKFALTLGNYQIYVQYNKFNKAKDIFEFLTENNSTEKLKEKILVNVDKWHFETEGAKKRVRKKLKLTEDADLIERIKEKVEQAQSLEDVGLMVDNEHGILVKTDDVILWFSSISFKINL